MASWASLAVALINVIAAILKHNSDERALEIARLRVLLDQAQKGYDNELKAWIDARRDAGADDDAGRLRPFSEADG